MIETSICTFISVGCCSFDNLCKENTNLTLFITSLTLLTFLTISLGSIFTIIFRIIPCLKLNYKEFLEKINENGIYDFTKISPTLLYNGKPDFNKDGWIILNALWYERAESLDEIKGCKERSQSLANLLHSSASSMVGSFITFIILFILSFAFNNNFDIIKFSLAYIVSLFFIIAHLCNYLGARRTMKLFTEFVLWNVLNNNKIRQFEKLI